jgi:hypothetical protein
MGAASSHRGPRRFDGAKAARRLRHERQAERFLRDERATAATREADARLRATFAEIANARVRVTPEMEGLIAVRRYLVEKRERFEEELEDFLNGKGR